MWPSRTLETLSINSMIYIIYIEIIVSVYARIKHIFCVL